jgi:hypothetical protein
LTDLSRLELQRVVESSRLLPGLLEEKLFKRGSVLGARSQVLPAPEITKESRDRAVAVLVLGRLVLNNNVADPAAHEDGGDTDTKALEVEGVRLIVWGNVGVGQVITGWDANRRRNMVTEATVLVEGKDEESLVPLLGTTDSFVNHLEPGLGSGNRARRVHRVKRAALRVDVSELRKLAGLGVSEKLGNKA